MKLQLMIAAVVTFLGVPATVHAGMTSTEFNADRERIEAEFEAARRKCNTFGGNAGDVCLAEARGDHRVALAELEERKSPSSRTRQKLHMAKVEAEFEIATEECDERINGAKEECLVEARSAFAREKANARPDRNPDRRVGDRVDSWRHYRTGMPRR
jgi:hypothetical protein